MLLHIRARQLGVAVSLAVPSLLSAQGTAADFARAEALGRRFQGLVVDVAERPTWLDASRFWYRKSVKGGNEFVLVDVGARGKRAPFDHARLAAGLSAASGQTYTGVTLPFSEFTLVNADSVKFSADAKSYVCTLSQYRCAIASASSTPASPGAGRRGGGSQFPDPRAASSDLGAWLGLAHEHDEQPSEGPWIEDDGLAAEVRAGQARARLPQQRQAAIDTNVVRSPDGTLDAYIHSYNVFIRPVASATPGAGIQLSWDGSEGRAYVLGGAQNRSLRWSPDSRKIAAYRVTPGYQRMVRFIESSPIDQVQPKYREQYYQKPGDEVTLREPALFDVASRTQVAISSALFPNAYSLSALQWWSDSRGFTFEYNARGHQVYRVIEIDASSGAARALISEEPKTFYSYRPASDGLAEPGSRFRRDLADGREIVWMSERDGWKHLYLYDGRTGRVKGQITRGEYVVRNVQRVDTAKRQLWFSAGGKDAGHDPYFTKHYRVNLDGSGLVAYTPENGTHSISWSPDSAHYVDSWTRVDLPPVTVLKRASDGSIVMPLDSGDASALVAAGFQPAEPFVAKGRDGTTDIWGVIFKPSNFDPTRKYPVIEQIYAGPQGSFAPKSFSTGGAARTLAEHGFIVVQVDGMGTANRSKAFHDVAWRNLADAGFPDRILWHKAIAAKYPWYDATRVGVYGTSAGGQNAMGALLFHSEFYKAAFSAAGCHDNRMDKMWWNEQWMGWPIGPHYAAASNVENAHRLKGDLLLVVGELDTNVDPSSTYQVANALIKANKMFDYLVIPGAGHTNGGAYGVRKMTDFFVRVLLSATPPNRNAF